MDLLSTVCTDAGFPVYSLQQGDPWTASRASVAAPTPAPAPATATTGPETSSRGKGRGRGNKTNRGRGRGAKTGDGRKPAWQVLQEKSAKLCDLFNLVSFITLLRPILIRVPEGLCTKSDTTCDKIHRCSKQTGAVYLCQEDHMARNCPK